MFARVSGKETIMATTGFYLDTRSSKTDTYPLKISICQNRQTCYIATNIFLKKSQWDGEKIVSHPQKGALNTMLMKVKLEVDTAVMNIGVRIRSLSASQIKAIVEQRDSNQDSFMNRFKQFIERKSGRTAEIYKATYDKVVQFDRDSSLLSFEDINKVWLDKFDAYMDKSGLSVNTKGIHLRNIRAVFNDAIDDGITDLYPFRKYKIKKASTPKRSLSVERLRELFYLPVEEHQQKYVDMFKLSFFLIGINMVDMLKLKGIQNGRIEYQRSKTKRLYSVKVEPEALEIIQKYHGKKFLLSPLDTYKDYKDFTKRLNDNLQLIGPVEIGKQGKKTRKPLFPELTTYWARHTWATIAAELDIPKETISAALGHSLGSEITSIYINFNQKKVDEANRKVIDYVLKDIR